MGPGIRLPCIHRLSTGSQSITPLQHTTIKAAVADLGKLMGTLTCDNLEWRGCWCWSFHADT